MAGRAFKFFTAPSTAAPLVGTTISQNILPNPYGQTVTVADASWMQNNDTMNVIPAVTTGPLAELAVNIQVVDSTHISAIFNRPHNSGDFLQLSWPCGDIILQTPRSPAAVASIFIGDSQNVTTAGVHAMVDLSLVLTFRMSQFGMGHSENTAQWWVIGNGTDEYLVSTVTE